MVTTDVTMVLDRSGSMQSMVDEVVEAFNQFVRDQQSPASPSGDGGTLQDQPPIPPDSECRLTLLQFADASEVVLDAVPVAQVPPLTADTYRPHGRTALLDAIGDAIAAARGRVAAAAEGGDAPMRVVIAILTDGQENASRRYRLAQVFQLITEARAAGWTVLFLAANQDAIHEGGRLGVDAKYRARLKGEKDSYKFAMEQMSSTVRSVRSTGVAPDLSSETEEDEQVH